MTSLDSNPITKRKFLLIAIIPVLSTILEIMIILLIVVCTPFMIIIYIILLISISLMCVFSEKLIIQETRPKEIFVDTCSQCRVDTRTIKNIEDWLLTIIVMLLYVGLYGMQLIFYLIPNLVSTPFEITISMILLISMFGIWYIGRSKIKNYVKKTLSKTVPPKDCPKEDDDDDS